MLTRALNLFILTTTLNLLGADPLVATFSIVARDPLTGEIGVAVQSKFVAVGSVVPYAEAGVGAIASQALGNVRYGPIGLKLLREGKSAREVVELMTQADPRQAYRQLGVIAPEGNSSIHTGINCMDWALSLIHI